MLLRSNRWHPATGWVEPLAAAAALDSPQTLVFAFCSADLGDDAAVFADVQQAFPQATLLGCSTAGEISGGLLSDASVVLAVARFENSALRGVQTPVPTTADSAGAGQRLAQALHAADLRAVIVLGDGVTVNGDALVDGLTRGLGADVLVSGGLAGDGNRFRRTWVVADSRPLPGHVQAVGLYGERLRVGSGCEGGWQDFGPLRSISRAQGTVLYELDGKPALDLYRNYLGERARELPGAALLFPLAIRPPGSSDRPLVRTILGIDEQARSMTFAGDMPEGWEARLMRCSPDRLIDSAGEAATHAIEGVDGNGPLLLISVSCVGRRLVLGERTEEEIEAALQGAPAGSVHVGFYSYGEIARAGGDGHCRLHNQTMTVTALGEV